MEDKSKKLSEPGSGIRSARTTSLFRAVNFELFATPVSQQSDTHTHDHLFHLFTEEICDDNWSSVYDVLCWLSPVFEQLSRSCTSAEII